MKRLTDHDKDYGPLTLGKTDSKMFGVSYSTGTGEDDDLQYNLLTGYLFDYAFRLKLPNLIKPIEIKVYPVSWNEATKKRLGRDYYCEYIHKEYGFFGLDDHVTFRYGAQSHNYLEAPKGVSERSKGFFIPWRTYRVVLDRLYDGEETLQWSRNFGKKYLRENMDALSQVRTVMTKRVFLVKDFDDKEVEARVHVTEIEWQRGEGCFKWLSWFMSGIRRKSIEIDFSQGVGRRKGDWKGGLTGISFEMQEGEDIPMAFKRFIAVKSVKDRDLQGLQFLRDNGCKHFEPTLT